MAKEGIIGRMRNFGMERIDCPFFFFFFWRFGLPGTTASFSSVALEVLLFRYLRSENILEGSSVVTVFEDRDAHETRLLFGEIFWLTFYSRSYRNLGFLQLSPSSNPAFDLFIHLAVTISSSYP